MTNKRIIEFFRNFGIAVVLAMFVLYILISFFSGRAKVSGLQEVNLKEGEVVQVDGDKWIVSEFDKLDTLGVIYIQLNKAD